ATLLVVDGELASYAAQVGPQLDRLRLGVMKAAVELGMRSGMLRGSGLDPDAFTVFAMLRNAYPRRAVPLRNYRAAYVYQEPAAFDRALAQMIGAQLVELSDADSVVLSAAGRDLMADVRRTGAQAAEGRWGSEVGPLLDLSDRCLVRAAESAQADGAFHLVAPPADEPDDSEAARFAERLTGLRFHRFDAHVASWAAAGFTAATIAALDPGPERDAVEGETNRRAGGPYDALTGDERTLLLEGLAHMA
ncbi:MAG TPA: hypothetical protein VFL59_06405, partial [Candidatus Nanopelagicales bacterium]|nr:hypothetical protein [Candidatus Nanopelagicales bacterium]